MKTCTKCKTEKEVTEFRKNKTSKDGIDYTCKSCRNIGDKAWRDKNKQHTKEWHAKNYQENKDKIDASHKRWSEKNAKSHKAYKSSWNKAHRRTRTLAEYGMTEKDFQDRIEKQNNKCCICENKFESITREAGKRYACIDHSHVTGEVRGLLCNKCNIGLGHFDDNIITMEKAIDYLKLGGNLCLS